MVGTPLFSAISSPDASLDCVKFLVSNGAGVALYNFEGGNLLHEVCRIDCKRDIFEHVFKDFGLDVLHRDYNDKRPLDICLEEGSPWKVGIVRAFTESKVATEKMLKQLSTSSNKKQKKEMQEESKGPQTQVKKKSAKQKVIN
jgi:hypothetical protein